MTTKSISEISPSLRTIGLVDMRHRLLHFWCVRACASLAWAISFLILVVLPIAVHAATVSFDPQERVVGLDSAFDVGVNIDAVYPLNVISIVIKFPDTIVPIDVTDGNSIINYWIEYPHYDPQTRTLTLAGMIPGGFVGTGGRLITLKLQGTEPGRVRLEADTLTSIAYRNTPDAQEEEIISAPLTLTVSAHRNNIDNTMSDKIAPESFTPAIVRYPDEQGDWVVVFATQDEGSGMYHYEVSESRFNVPFLRRYLWRAVESPYVLRDQLLGSYVHIRATDKAGNERIETILPTRPWYALESQWIAYGLIFAACILGIWWRQRRS